MGVATHVPLMNPGATGRNALVAVGAVVALPLGLLVVLFYFPAAVALNRNGLADAVDDSRLSRLPGFGGGT